MFFMIADTHNAAYGIELSCFGVYDNYELAEKAKYRLMIEYPSYAFDIHKFELNETKEIYLGGYIE